MSRRASPCLAVLLALALSSLAGVRSASAQDGVADFYRGRTVNIVIGYSVGGGFDLYARVLARHLGRHIPGNPAIVPQNMPGAASLKAVEYLLTVAPRDGSVIGTFSHTVPIAPLIGTARIEPRPREWIGSMAAETSLCVARPASPVKTLADLRRLPFTAGGTGKGSDPDMLATLLRVQFGLPVKLVSGYPGTAEIALATERGEVDGFCGLSLSTLASRYKDWLDGPPEKRISLVLQANLQRAQQLPHVPLLQELARNERERRIITLIVAPQAMARPFAMPPGTPKPRADAIRAAFRATMTDKDFLADAKASRIEISPVLADELQALLTELYATPPDVLREAATALGG